MKVLVFQFLTELVDFLLEKDLKLIAVKLFYFAFELFDALEGKFILVVGADFRPAREVLLLMNVVQNLLDVGSFNGLQSLGLRVFDTILLLPRCLPFGFLS